MEIEITEEEARQLNAAIMSLEEAESKAPEGTSTALAVAAVGLGVVLLFSL